MKIETDRVVFQGGVRHGATLGSPISLRIDNNDFANWAERMSPAPSSAPGEPLTRPRPGHADLAGGLKYDTHELRNVLERASARETAARTAAGAVARKLLSAVGIEIASNVVRIGGLDASDPAAVRVAIQEAAHAGDTLGGLFEVVAKGVMPGLGSHAQWDRKLDGLLAQAFMSIQAIKGVEIGAGFEAANQRGSAVHDAIAYDHGNSAFTRPTNRAGGLEGGMSTGEAIVVRAAMKPISTLKQPLPSVDVQTKEVVLGAHERSDICAVPAAAIVGEAMMALTLAEAVLDKFGGDSMVELAANVASYRERMRAY